MKSNDPSKTKYSTRTNKGYFWNVCFVGFIVEALRKEAHAEAHKPVVGKTQQHKVHTHYKLIMLDKGIKYLIYTQIAERCIYISERNNTNLHCIYKG